MKPSGEGFTKSESRREASQKHSLLTPFFILALAALTGCVNGMRSKSVISDRAYLNASNQTLAQVVRSAANPSTEIDLIGNGTGELTKSCTSVQNAFGQTSNVNSPTGTSTCRCAFRYFKIYDGNQTQEFTAESDTVYRESNLIRCALPSEIQSQSLSSVQVSVRYGTSKASDSFSNEVPFNLTAGVGYAIDPTDASSFVRAYRYQCTAVVTLKPTYWSDVYDRDLSEDPRATTPMNFYTTNVGRSIAITSSGFKSGTPNATARKPLPGWDCPANPLDPRIQYSSNKADNVALLGHQYSVGGTARLFQPDFKDRDGSQPLLTKYDMRIYSEAMRGLSPTERGDNSLMIFPPVPNQINKSEFYVARLATGAFRIPINAIVAPGVNTDPAGEKGPLPIGYGVLATSSLEGESCPTGIVPIPAGFKFAKLWLFRSSLTSRAVQTFPAASIASGNHFNNKALSCEGVATGFAYRDNNPANCYGSNDCRFEIPFPTSGAATPNHSFSPNPAAKQWPMELAQQANSQSASTTQVFDYLYVVSPTTVSREQILSGAEEAKKYIPYRYVSSLDCRDGSTPNGANGAFCIPGRTILNYNLTEDIGYAFSSTDTSLDTTSVNMGANAKFPLCVLVRNDS